MVETKTCTRCGEAKNITDFRPERKYRGGHRSFCRPCDAEVNKDWKLRNQYGIGLSEYRRILEHQGGCCALCRKPETMVIKGKVADLAVDHCHDTGVVRGLLCQNCNQGIGKLQDSPDLLRRAASYIESFRTS